MSANSQCASCSSSAFKHRSHCMWLLARERQFLFTGHVARRAISRRRCSESRVCPLTSPRDKRCSFSVLGSRKQQNSWFFQAFPLPSVKWLLQKPAGSSLAGGVTGPAPGSPGSPQGQLLSPIGGCCLHVVQRTLGWYKAGWPEDLSLGCWSLLALTLPYSSTRSPQKPGCRAAGPGGRRAVTLDCLQLESLGLSV